jgi:hypothetical protein
VRGNNAGPARPATEAPADPPAGRRADHRRLQRRRPPPQQPGDRDHGDRELRRYGPGLARGHVRAERVRGGQRGPAHHPGRADKPLVVGPLDGGEDRELQRAEQRGEYGERDGGQVTNPPRPQHGGERAGHRPAGGHAQDQPGEHAGGLGYRRGPACLGRRAEHQPACRAEHGDRRHAHQRRGEQAGDERTPGQRQQRKACRVERLVHAEEDKRQQQPAEHQHGAGERGHHDHQFPVAGEPGQGEQQETGEGEPEPEQAAEHEQGDPPGLPAHAVAEDPQLQPGEVPDPHSCRMVEQVRHSHDSSWPVAVRPPTTSTKTSSSDLSPRTSVSVPIALMAPPARIATWLQSRSTTSITWLEKITVPPPVT